jgi:hypothetical protein
MTPQTRNPANTSLPKERGRTMTKINRGFSHGSTANYGFSHG